MLEQIEEEEAKEEDYDQQNSEFVFVNNNKLSTTNGTLQSSQLLQKKGKEMVKKGTIPDELKVNDY